MTGSAGKIERAIEQKASAVLDTSILLDYLKAFCEKPANYDEQYRARMLKTIIPQFGKAYITPYVLAEVCNLAKTRTANSKQFLLRSTRILEDMGETGRAAKKNDIVQHKYFSDLGATDVAGVLCCTNEHKDAYLLIKDEEAAEYATDERKRIITLGEIRAHYINIGGK